MDDLINNTNVQNGTWFTQTAGGNVSTWENSVVENSWGTLSDLTLWDGSVVLSNGTTLNPQDYMLYLFQLMVENNSSDIYLTYWEEPAIRIYWEAHRVTVAPKLEDTTLEAISSILMSSEDKAMFDRDLSCDLGYSVHGRRYRINISRQRWHKMIVARLLEEKIPTIDGLWLPEILNL